MCCRHGQRHQPPIVALAGAIYGAYQNRKARKAGASAQEIGIEGGKYATVPKQSHTDAMDELALHEKDVPPPDYDDVVRNNDDAIYHDSSDRDVGLRGGANEDNEFVVAGENDENAKDSQKEGDGMKMGFFERMQAMKESKRLEREERRESWKAGKQGWKERKAERHAEWRAGGERRGCCGRAC